MTGQILCFPRQIKHPTYFLLFYFIFFNIFYYLLAQGFQVNRSALLKKSDPLSELAENDKLTRL